MYKIKQMPDSINILLYTFSQVILRNAVYAYTQTTKELCKYFWEHWSICEPSHYLISIHHKFHNK